MKSIKFLSVAFALLFMMTSCSKENLTETIDQTPEVVVPETNENENSYALNSTTVTIADAKVGVDADDAGVAQGYSMVVTTDNNSNIPGVFFGVAFGPNSVGEYTLQEGDYQGVTASGVDGFTLAELDAWIDNGADTLNMPNMVSAYYDAAGLTISIANVVENVSTQTITQDIPGLPPYTYEEITDTAEATFSGTITDITDGTEVNVSGTFPISVIRKQ